MEEKTKVLGNSPVELVDYSEGELPAIFEPVWVESLFRKDENGKPYGRTEIHCNVYHVGGDMTPHVVDPNNPNDKWIRKYPRQWQAFVNKEKQTADGTPLHAWSAITVARKQELNHLNIYTVEQLAEAPDNVLQELQMGGYKLKEDAQKWLKDNTGVDAKLEELAQENKKLKKQYEELALKQAGLASKKKRGRPKKKKEVVNEPTDDPTECHQ